GEPPFQDYYPAHIQFFNFLLDDRHHRRRRLPSPKSRLPQGEERGMKKHSKAEPLYHAVLILPVLLVLAPIVWTFLTSLKYFKDVVSNRFGFTPTVFNFLTLFTEDENFSRIFGNSIVVASLATVACLAITTLASYSLSRFKWNKAVPRVLFGWTIAIESIPAISIVIPIFMAANSFGLIDTKGLLVLVYSLLNLPFTLMLMYSFFKQVPKEIEESAVMDGAREWTLFSRIMFPLTKPILLTAALFRVHPVLEGLHHGAEPDFHAERHDAEREDLGLYPELQHPVRQHDRCGGDRRGAGTALRHLRPTIHRGRHHDRRDQGVAA
ncbi:MAG: carbohydrate ABC transporter permease, partial [Bdellovibrionaceae bacterium]|nr:carbohydrate ABC transporter permease [Pseudobdellovibrionaceae bacterium]